MKNRRLGANLLLLLAALIWGISFVAASVAAERIGSFTFNCIRSFIGAIVLLPVTRLFDGKKKPTFEQKGGKNLIVGGICCGVALSFATVLQQIGLATSTPGKAGFLTALYIIIVPLLGILFGQKPSAMVWLGVALGLVGIYLLCVTQELTIERGDILLIAGSLFFSVHILLVDRFSPLVDGVRLSCLQFLTVGIICLGPMLLIEKPQLADITAAWLPIMYMGVMSCGVAYTLQIVAQKHTEPVVACLAFSMESVFAALAGWAILGIRMSVRELLGAVLVFAAILLAQMQPKALRRSDDSQTKLPVNGNSDID